MDRRYRVVSVLTGTVPERPTSSLNCLMSDFLATLPERVLILDGAFGTWVQGQDLGPDDFGGEVL